jgi:hypothetical protein
MKKITLKLLEILNLYIEITGTNPLNNIITHDNEYDVLLKENLSISTKFKLYKLITSLDKEIDIFIKNRDELVKKHGTTTDKTTYTVIHVDEFNKEIEELLQLDIEIEYHELILSEFEHIKTSNIQPTLYKMFS